MPESRYYIVEQVRQVKVVANSLVEATQVGDATLHNKPIPSGMYGRAVSPILEREIKVTEDR